MLGTGIVATAMLIQTLPERYEDNKARHTTQSHLPTPYLEAHQ